MSWGLPVPHSFLLMSSVGGRERSLNSEKSFPQFQAGSTTREMVRTQQLMEAYEKICKSDIIRF